ncbi:MAG: PilZ domain-containing protein [Candidatus Omnitrophota bacterium]
MLQGAERRRHKRVRRPFVARFQVLDEKGESGIFPGWDIVTAQDLGGGGILFNYSEEIAVNSNLEFKINFPTLPEPVNCRGKVVRNDKRSDSSRVRIAAMFTDIDDKEKQEINSFAEEFSGI